jgi:hypothetical protein
MGELTGTDLNDKLRQEVADGLLYTHARLSDNTKKTLEAASFLYGLIELLSEKGLISIEEVDECKHAVAQRLAEKNSEQGIGVLLQEPEYDKYTFEGEAKIDCENRIHLCKAACCRLPFALSKQDIREGIIHWDLDQPTSLRRRKTGTALIWSGAPAAVPCENTGPYRVELMTAAKPKPSGWILRTRLY